MNSRIATHNYFRLFAPSLLVCLLLVLGYIFFYTPPAGNLCLAVRDSSMTQTVSGCTVDFLQLAKDPRPFRGSTCNGPGEYLFQSLPVAKHDAVVHCGGQVAHFQIEVERDQTSNFALTLPEPPKPPEVRIIR